MILLAFQRSGSQTVSSSPADATSVQDFDFARGWCGGFDVDRGRHRHERIQGRDPCVGRARAATPTDWSHRSPPGRWNPSIRSSPPGYRQPTAPKCTSSAFPAIIWLLTDRFQAYSGSRWLIRSAGMMLTHPRSPRATSVKAETLHAWPLDLLPALLALILDVGAGSGRDASEPYQSGRSGHWLKIKNPDSPAMVRHREGNR
jgi:hypothetical protein